MKNYAKILILTFSICLFSSFTTTDATEISSNEKYSSNGCELIDTVIGDLYGRTVHFSSYECAVQVGATNIQPGGLWSACATLTCV